MYYALYNLLRRCGPANGLWRAAMGLGLARHEDELPHQGVARAAREHRRRAHTVQHVLMHEHLVRVRRWGWGTRVMVGVGAGAKVGFGFGLGEGVGAAPWWHGHLLRVGRPNARVRVGAWASAPHGQGEAVQVAPRPRLARGRASPRPTRACRGDN